MSNLNKNTERISRKDLTLAIVTTVIGLVIVFGNLNTVINLVLVAISTLSHFLVYAGKAEEKKKLSIKRNKDDILFRIGQKKVSYLENIIQNSTDIIFTIDNDMFILKFNKGAEYSSGYTQEEILGKPLSTLFPDTKLIKSIITETKETGSSINKELQMVTKDKKIIVLSVSISEMNYGTSNINGFVITAKDITEKIKLETELKKKNAQLQKLAITDGLTRLFNIRHFKSQIQRELKRAQRNAGRDLSLIMIDVDNFKVLNDTEGHQTGDHVLRSLAEVIRFCIREDIDSAYRYGGDEFIIILPDTKKKDSLVVAKRIQKQFGAFKFGETSLSIGITDAVKNDIPETIVKRVDMALYKSKETGKNKITVL